MKETVHKFYGNRLRIRACGILIRSGEILLANHRGLSNGDFWAPPGGGIELGETAEHCLKREWKEETNLEVEIGDFLFACELIDAPLHAIELFFEVKEGKGDLKLGEDPEYGAPTVLTELRFFSENDLKTGDKSHLHGMFKKAQKPEDILSLRGYLKL